MIITFLYVKNENQTYLVKYLKIFIQEKVTGVLTLTLRQCTQSK